MCKPFWVVQSNQGFDNSDEKRNANISNQNSGNQAFCDEKFLRKKKVI
jgi:hypothetical protein